MACLSFLRETKEANKLATDLNRDNYETEIQGSKGAALVDFWGEQCIPCKALVPAVEKIENEYSGKLKVYKVNAPLNRMLCAKLRVLSMPTFVLYKDGVENKRLTGEKITPGDIKAAVEAVLA